MLDSQEEHKEFIVPTDTGTHADALALVGFADLIAELANGDKSNTRIIFDGGMGRVIAPVSVSELMNGTFSPGFPYVVQNKTDDVPEFAKYNYWCVERKREEYNQYRSSKGKDKKAEHASEEAKELAQAQETSQRVGHEYWQLIVAKRMHNLSNKVFSAISTKLINQGALPELDKLWPKIGFNVSNNQLLFPVGAKGASNVNSIPHVDQNSIQPKHLNAFAIWMMLRGFWKYSVVFYSKDFMKVYTILPANLSLQELEKIRTNWVSHVFGHTSIKVDVLRILQLVEALIDYSIEDARTFFGPIIEILHSIRVTTYRNLGQSYALSDIAEYSLPNWYPIDTQQQKHKWENALKAHRSLAFSLDDRTGEDLNLLRAQLNAITANSVAAMLEFYREYAVLAVGKKARSGNIYLLNESITKEVIMALAEQERMERIKELLQSEAFLNFGRAVRTATINALRNENSFEPFYGLPQEWKRASKFADKFIVEIGDFVSKYNLQLAKIEQMHQGRLPGSFIRENEVQEVIDAVKDLGSEVVCNLLLAIGTSLTKRREED